MGNIHPKIEGFSIIMSATRQPLRTSEGKGSRAMRACRTRRRFTRWGENGMGAAAFNVLRVVELYRGEVNPS
jgi:hypothetical protein